MLNNCSVIRHPCFVSDINGNVYSFSIKLTTGFQTETDILSHFKKMSTYCQFMVSLKICMYLFLVALGLHCCSQAFSSCGKQGLSVAVQVLLTVATSLVAEHRPQARRLQQLRHAGLVAPRDVESSLTRDGIVCALPWQVDSNPVYHQGSPSFIKNGY